jgi:hypothetical protein
MNTVRMRGAVLFLLVGLVLLGGCATNPWGQIPIIPMEPANLIENGDAENNGLGWNFSSFDATVHSASGNPAFAIRNDATLRQTVNIGNPLGAYVVVMAMSATETIGPTGMGMIWGDFIDAVDPQLVVGGLFSNNLYSTAAVPALWVFLTDYGPIPPNAGQIMLYMANTEMPGVPHDGAWTWFDDVELWIVETEQEAIQLINDYKARHMP